jgi:hypothetical protein
MATLHLAAKIAAAVLVTALLAVPVQAMAQEAGETTGALPEETSTSPIQRDDAVVNQTEPAQPTDSGTILVAKHSVEVRAGPSSSASILYGFPAGRSFRLIGREAGFAQIEDLNSRATGWINESALALSSPRPQAPSLPSGSGSASSNQSVATTSTPSKPGQSGGGIFGNGGGPLSGILGGLFGAH